MSEEKKPYTYRAVTPPLMEKDHSEWTAKETETYFQWHLSVLPERIDYLTSEVSRSLSVPKEQLDQSAESLLLVWKWFLATAEIEQTSEERMEMLRRNCPYPEPLKSFLLEEYYKTRFSLQTEYIIQDIGRYIGQVFIKNTPGTFWTYYTKPKTEVFVNLPVVGGFLYWDCDPPFKERFEPHNMVSVQAQKLKNGDSRDDDLYNLYMLWSVKLSPTERPTPEALSKIKGMKPKKGSVVYLNQKGERIKGRFSDLK